MGTTSRLSLRYPELSDSADVPRDIENLADDIDNAAIYASGTFSARPASTVGSPGIAGRYYFATDTSRLYLDTGTSWVEVASGAGSVTSTMIVDGPQVPIGAITQYAGSSAPTNWLVCDGSEQPVSTYAALDSILGTTYGSRTNGSGGAGSSHFRVPNLKGRAPVGRDSTQTEFDSLGEAGGAKSVAITKAQMPSHDHGGVTGNDSPDHTHGPAGGISSFSGGSGTNTGFWLQATNDSNNAEGQSYATAGASARHTHSVSSEGSGQAHDNLQPYLVVNFIIRAL